MIIYLPPGLKLSDDDEEVDEKVQELLITARRGSPAACVNAALRGCRPPLRHDRSLSAVITHPNIA